jgi:hypothetical protein
VAFRPGTRCGLGEEAYHEAWFKIRFIPSPGFVKAYKTLGANPVLLPYVPCFAGLASEGRRFDKL